MEQPNDESKYQELRAAYDVMVKSARRCARDLNHCADNVSDSSLRDMFRERHSLYAVIFAPTTDYHIQMQWDLENARREYEQQREYVRQLQAELKAKKDEIWGLLYQIKESKNNW